MFQVELVDRVIPKYRVCIIGAAAVGKTSLVSQCLTSDFMNTYDASLGELKYLDLLEKNI